jgi:PASTA domain
MRVFRLVAVPAAAVVVFGLGLSALFLGTSGTTGPTPTATPNPTRSASAPDRSTTFICGKRSEIVIGPPNAARESTTVTMPNVVGQTLTKAEDELYCSGIRYTVLSVPTQSAPANSVLDQSPAAGTMVSVPATVHLTVAFG